MPDEQAVNTPEGTEIVAEETVVVPTGDGPEASPPDHPYPGEATTNPEPVKPEPVDITVDDATAFNLKLQEFDMKIAESETTVADLKRQKASFVYNTNLQNVVAIAKKKEADEAAADQPQVVNS